MRIIMTKNDKDSNHYGSSSAQVCTATFKPRGPDYVTLEMRRRRSEIAAMAGEERHETLGRFFLKWRLTWRPAPPQTPALERRRRRLQEER